MRASSRSIHQQLKRLGNARHAATARRFFKTAPGEYGAGDRFYGIRVPVLRTLAAQHRAASLRDVSMLLSSPWHEARLLALLILVDQYARTSAMERDAIHSLYLRRTSCINNWDLVDSSAEHIIGAHRRDGRSRLLSRLARSPRLWERRMAILATFHDIKRGEFDETLRIARMLLDDPHDLIHKAVGWMLREVGKRDRRVEEAFLRRYAPRMPRTMLRYAIERFPAALRRRYLAA